VCTAQKTVEFLCLGMLLIGVFPLSRAKCCRVLFGQSVPFSKCRKSIFLVSLEEERFFLFYQVFYDVLFWTKRWMDRWTDRHTLG
jgi:hypothetical protein